MKLVRPQFNIEVLYKTYKGCEKVQFRYYQIAAIVSTMRKKKTRKILYIVTITFIPEFAPFSAQISVRLILCLSSREGMNVVDTVFIIYI